VFFYLYGKGRLAGKPVVLIDHVEELINSYRVVQGQVEELIAELEGHEPHKGDAAYYYSVRAWDREPEYAHRSDVERAARFLVLNHTCYNGLYRVNRRGLFNVPFGRHHNPMLYDAANLRAANRALQGITLRVGDFVQCLETAGPGDLVYLDPPYHPVSATANFTSYTSTDFGIEDQQRLAAVFRELDRRGCRVMLSNSCTELVRRLYEGYEQVQVYANRAINSKSDERRAVLELLILNQYER